MAPEPEKEPERSSISSWTECSEQNCSDCSSLSSRERISDPLDKYIPEQYESWEDWLSGPKMTYYVKIKSWQHSSFIDQNNHVKKNSVKLKKSQFHLIFSISLMVSVEYIQACQESWTFQDFPIHHGTGSPNST